MYFINKNVKDLYRVKFHDERQNVLRLDMNENPDGLPLEFVEKVKKKITPSFLATYPEKDRLSQLIAEHNGIDTHNISISCGSDEAMRLIFQCFGEEKKEVLTVTPTFEMYDVYSKMFGMNHKTVKYSSCFKLSVDNILAQINMETGIIVLLNPNSPIGVCWSRDEAKLIIQKARDNNAIVVVDEAYHYFCRSTFIDLIEEYDNLLVLRTFSKLYSCAGLRIGYVAANEQLIHYIDNAESTFNVNNVAILFAEELLKDDELNKKLIDIEAEGRKWITERLKSKGYEVFSAEGNYVLFKPVHQSQFIVEKLKERKIWIRDYSKGILKGWIRVSTGCIKSMEIFFNNLIEIDS